MKTARVVVIGVALVAGLAAALLARNLSAPKVVVTQSAPIAVTDTVDVLVAAKDLSMGTALDSSALQWQAWPRSGISPSYLTRADKPNADQELAGSIARTSFVAGEPINEAKLIRSDRGFMSAILPAGKRAVATAITADTSAGGFILPNDHVDVIMTRRIQEGSGQDRYATETVLSNVRVLAIDQTIGEKNGEKVVVGQTATLELSSDQAEILTVAQQMTQNQKLTLALRSLADSADAASPDARHLIQTKTGENGVLMVRNGVPKQVELQ